MFFTAAPGLLITLQITYFFRRTQVSGRAIHTTSFIYEYSSFFRAKITLNNKGGHGNKFPASTTLFFSLRIHDNCYFLQITWALLFGNCICISSKKRMSKIKFFLKYTNFFPRSDWEQVRKDTRTQSPKSNKL